MIGRLFDYLERTFPSWRGVRVDNLPRTVDRKPLIETQLEHSDLSPEDAETARSRERERRRNRD